MEAYQLTIVVPVYNEEENIAKFCEEMDVFLQSTQVRSQVLFVDDGSTDNSLSLIKEVVAKKEHYSYASLERNSGLSAALKAGIDLCSTPYWGYIDADLQTSPSDFPLYFDHLEEYSMINGVRANRKDSFVKKISSVIANGFRRFMINDGIQDTCCPLKIAHTKDIQRLPYFKGMHRFMPALIQLQGGKVKQVEVRHFPRYAGTAKYHLFNRMIWPFLDTLAFVWMKRRNIRYQVREHQEARSGVEV